MILFFDYMEVFDIFFGIKYKKREDIFNGDREDFFFVNYFFIS